MCLDMHGPLSFLSKFEMTHSVSVNFTSRVTSCVGLHDEEPQTTLPMSFTWASRIAANMLMRC